MSMYSYLLGSIGIMAVFLCGGALDSDKPALAILLMAIFCICMFFATKDERR